VALAIAVVGAGAAVGQQAASSGSASTALLAAGAEGSAVTTVQKALGISTSGVFDQRTKVAVESFQRQHGLVVDGIVGPQTRGALGLASSGTASTGTSGSTGSTSTTQSSAAGNASLQAIAQCESGGNPQAVGGGGQFRGKYQFTRESWQAVGGTGDPAAASEAEQDQRAAMLYQRSGASNWPVCGR
jgi:Transglycosylase-like domain/Putative peptidoglycan binding domain